MYIEYWFFSLIFTQQSSFNNSEDNLEIPTFLTFELGSCRVEIVLYEVLIINKNISLNYPVLEYPRCNMKNVGISKY